MNELSGFYGVKLVLRISGMTKQTILMGSAIHREEGHFLMQFSVMASLAGDGAGERG